MSSRPEFPGEPQVPPTPRPNKGPSETGTSGTTDTPPRGRAPKAEKAGDSPKSPPRERAGRTPVLQKKLEELFATPALIYSFAGDDYGAHIIATRTPALAEAWYDLAQENAAVKRILTRLVEGSAWGGVVLSSMAVAVPLLGHHGFIPEIDPFSALYPPLPEDGRGPIVPPPPRAEQPRPPAASNARNGGGAPSDMTPPIAPDQPPGVVTVAGTNARHTG